MSKDAVIEELETELAELRKEHDYFRGKMRMVVSHCTGARTQDVDLSCNDICVMATMKVNDAWYGGVEMGFNGAKADKTLEELLK